MSFDPNSPPLTQQQLRDSERLIHQLKVGDLHKLLEKLHHSKKGLKGDLVDRVIRLIRDPGTQKAVFNYLNSEMSKRTNQNSNNVYVRGLPGVVPFNQNNFGRIGMVQNGTGGSTMYGAQSMIQQAARPAPIDLKIVPLPFYDVHTVLLQPMELSPAPAPNQRYTSKLAFTINITSEMFDKIKYDLNKEGLPRHEVQLRFFNCTELKEPQKDDFPLNINVRLNGATIQLPGLIPTNKPNAEAKRPSRPVCLTQQCQRRPGPQQLSLDWLCDKRTWAVAVYYVFRVNADILYRRMVENPSKHHEIEVTRREIIKKLGGNDDDGIAMDQLKIGLLCPLVKVRMTCPARCSDCTHLQCFDLNSYLMMNEKRPVWNCPVCSGYAPYERLIIDEYFKDVLGKVDSSTTEVELKPDGRFEMLKNDEAFDISSDDDDGVQLKKEIKPENGLGSATTSNGNGAGPTAKTYSNDDVIVLSDSDDDDGDVARAISNSLKGDEPRTPPPELENSGGSGSGGGTKRKAIEIITLDDTPPRPSEAKRRTENVSSSTSSAGSSTNNNNNSSESAALIQRNDSTSSNISVGRIPLPNGAPTTSQQTPTTLVEALEKINHSNSNDKLVSYHNQQDLFPPSSMHQNQMDYSYGAPAYNPNSWRMASGSAMHNNYQAPPPTPMTPMPLIGRQMNDVMGNPMGGGVPPTFNFAQQNFNHQPPPPQNMQNMMGNDMTQYNIWGDYLNAMVPFVQQQQQQQGQYPPNNHQQQNQYRK